MTCLVLGCSLLQVHLLFDRLDAKKAGVISKEEFADFVMENPDFLLLFLIAKPHLLTSFKKDTGEILYANGN